MFSDFSKMFNLWLQHYVATTMQTQQPYDRLVDSINYSLSTEGKRFRPYLAVSVAQLLGADTEKARSVALAVEFIHTYSLIHDDLPCMDNDDFRRGKATNHKVYGEALALLAGDGLLTEAFLVVLKDPHLTDSQKVQISTLLSDYSGLRGMVGGQVIDMEILEPVSPGLIEQMHLLKTGRLIQVAALGGALTASANEKDLKSIQIFSENLGLAFQIKDDLLDVETEKMDHKNFAKSFGQEQTLKKLNQLSEAAKLALEPIQSSSPSKNNLLQLIDFNLIRRH